MYVDVNVDVDVDVYTYMCIYIYIYTYTHIHTCIFQPRNWHYHWKRSAEEPLPGLHWGHVWLSGEALGCHGAMGPCQVTGVRDLRWDGNFTDHMMEIWWKYRWNMELWMELWKYDGTMMEIHEFPLWGWKYGWNLTDTSMDNYRTMENMENYGTIMWWTMENYGKSRCWRGKLTVSVAMASITILNCQRVTFVEIEFHKPFLGDKFTNHCFYLTEFTQHCWISVKHHWKPWLANHHL